jgi:DNA methyltransferase 1-associated protein 1
MRQAKSQIQTQKITQALIELGIPDILQLPTQRVMDAFENLIQRVQKLVDARKVLEKEEAEARIQGGLRKELVKEDLNADGTVAEKQPEPETIEEDEEEEEEEVKEEEQRSDEEEEEEEFEGNEDDGEGSEEGSEVEVENSDQDAEGDGDEMEVE